MCAIGAQARRLQREVAWLIKWNPRTTPVETIAQARVADANTAWTVLRAGFAPVPVRAKRGHQTRPRELERTPCAPPD